MFGYQQPRSAPNSFESDLFAGLLPFVPQESGERRFRVAGVDLGQSHDYAAVAVLERWDYAKSFVGPIMWEKRRWIVKKLQRWPRGTDYVTIQNDLAELDVNFLCVEYNGVGQPVFDNVRAACTRAGNPAKVLGVNHTGGQFAHSSVRTEGRHGGLLAQRPKAVWYVPKASMVSSIEIAMQSDQYAFPPALVENGMYKLLKDEMDNYQTRTSKGGTSRPHKSFGNKEGPDEHDDLCVALGIATYMMRQLGNRTLDDMRLRGQR